MNSCLPVDSTVSLPGKPCAGIWCAAMSVTKGRGRGEQGMKGSERYSRDEKRRGQRSGRVYRERAGSMGQKWALAPVTTIQLVRHTHSVQRVAPDVSELASLKGGVHSPGPPLYPHDCPLFQIWALGWVRALPPSRALQ